MSNPLNQFTSADSSCYYRNAFDWVVYPTCGPNLNLLFSAATDWFHIFFGDGIGLRVTIYKNDPTQCAKSHLANAISIYHSPVTLQIIQSSLGTSLFIPPHPSLLLVESFLGGYITPIIPLFSSSISYHPPSGIIFHLISSIISRHSTLLWINSKSLFRVSLWIRNRDMGISQQADWGKSR